MSDEHAESPPMQPGDQSITCMAQDAMEWQRHIYALLRTLERAETPFVLGVYGGWGSGKTSFVNCLGDAAVRGEYSETPKYEWRVVKVNPWECDTPEDAKRLIATSLWDAVFNSAEWDDEASWKDRAWSWMRARGEAIAVVADAGSAVLGVSKLGTAVFALFSSDASVAKRYRDHFQRDLAHFLGEREDGSFTRRMMVVIDDLDRCRPEIIPEVLETVKLYLDQQGCVFVLAADPERVGQVLGKQYGADEQNAEQLGQRYLEKIVQLPFYVPRMSDEAAAGFLEQCASLLNPAVPIGEEMRSLLLDHVLQRNPRAIKRFCLTHGLLAELGEDLDGDKLAKVLAIRMRFPNLHRFYSLPSGADLLLQDQRQARGETAEEDAADARDGVMRREEAERYAGWLEDPTLRRVLGAEPPFANEGDVDRYFELAGAGGAPESEVPDELAEALTMLGSDDPRARESAVRLLGSIGEPRVVEPLIERLGDEDARVCAAAAGALGEIGDARAVGPLTERLGDADGDVRGTAAGALGEIGDERAVTPLIERLEDEDEDVRMEAARALGEIGDERAVEPLIARLEDETGSVCSDAAWALGKIGDAQAVQPLIELLGDEAWSVREVAARALGEIGDARAVAPLIAQLDDEEEVVRWAAASALGAIGDKRAVEPLIERLEDGDKYVRTVAALALGKIGAAAEEALQRLREVAAEDSDEDVRDVAQEVIAQIEAAIADEEDGRADA